LSGTVDISLLALAVWYKAVAIMLINPYKILIIAPGNVVEEATRLNHCARIKPTTAQNPA
jgi:hypothetical protein